MEHLSGCSCFIGTGHLFFLFKVQNRFRFKSSLIKQKQSLFIQTSPIMAPSDNISILAFAGSLRKDSYNKSLLRAARDLAPDTMKIEFFDLEGIPFFSEDVEAKGDPAYVKKFKEAIRKADGLLIATPEYNYGMSSTTKAAIEWASRPPKDAPLEHKAVGIMGASTSLTGTARAQGQLRQSLSYTNSYCMSFPEILVYQADSKFDEDGNLTHEKTREFLKKYMEALQEWVVKHLKYIQDSGD